MGGGDRAGAFIPTEPASVLAADEVDHRRDAGAAQVVVDAGSPQVLPVVGPVDRVGDRYAGLGRDGTRRGRGRVRDRRRVCLEGYREQVVLLLVEAATGVRLTEQHDVERADVGGGEAARLQGGQDVNLREGVEGGGPMLLFATYQHHELVVDQVPLLAATHLLHLSAQDEM